MDQANTRAWLDSVPRFCMGWGRKAWAVSHSTALALHARSPGLRLQKLDMPIILALGKQRQEDYKFKIILGHTVSLRPA